MLGDVNKIFVFKSLLTMPSNVLPQENFPAYNLNRSEFDFSLKVKVMGSNPGYLLKSFLLYELISFKSVMDLTMSYMDIPKKRPKRRIQLRHLIELDFLSLSPLHRCRTNPFMQFYDPLAGNVIYF